MTLGLLYNLTLSLTNLFLHGPQNWLITQSTLKIYVFQKTNEFYSNYGIRTDDMNERNDTD